MRTGFIAAGLTNIAGILLFTRGLTCANFFAQYPEVFGFFGCIGVILWGLAYLSVQVTWTAAPQLMLLFAAEKAVYVVTWLYWLADRGSRLPALFQADPLTAMFYASYGVIDLAFMAFFLRAFRA